MKLNIVVLFVTLLIAPVSMAQDTGAPDVDKAIAAETGPSTAASEPAAAEPSSDDLVKSVVKIASDWKAGGALAGVAAVLALLLQVSKMNLFRKLLDDKGREWMRPVGLTLLSAAGGVVTALQAGAPKGAAALAGAMAGLSGVGARELFKHLSADERSRVRVDIDAVSQAADILQKQLEATAATQGPAAVAALAVKTAAMKNLPVRGRLEALSDLAVPPKAA